MVPPVVEPMKYLQYSSTGFEPVETRIIAERPVALFVNGEPWLTFMCTPTHLEALGIGFLYNEGIIDRTDEVSIARVCEEGCQLDVWLKRVVARPEQWRRTSGCTGGATSIETVVPQHAVFTKETIFPEMILTGMEDLLRSQELYKSTRGVHCSMMTDCEGTAILAEDIGRHNTLDKLAGRLLLENPPLVRRLIFTTGRVSSEMLQKTARLSAPVIVSRTSPTALSIHLAEELGITLIGYARRNQFNVYTHPERLVQSPPTAAAQPLSGLATG